jgi:hypothetical protein
MRRAGLPVVLLLAVVLGGCGDDGFDRAALAHRASAICLDYDRQARELGTLDLSDQVAAHDYFEAAAALASRQQGELEDLVPADDVADEYDAFLEATAKAEDLLSGFAQSEDDLRGPELQEAIAPISADVDAAARAIGAGDCGATGG